jgi:hypothetical protein
MGGPGRSKKNQSLVPRSPEDMLEALRRHTKLLRAYKQAAFTEGEDRDYWGEVAAKLRLLLLKVGRNEPLLTRLLELYRPGARVFVVSGVPLSDFLKQSGLALQIGEEFIALTNAELINTWATKHGAAHEDWALTEAFDLIRSRTSDVADTFRLAAHRLALITEAVLEASEQLLRDAKENRDGPTR